MHYDANITTSVLTLRRNLFMKNSVTHNMNTINKNNPTVLDSRFHKVTNSFKKKFNKHANDIFYFNKIPLVIQQFSFKKLKVMIHILFHSCILKWIAGKTYEEVDALLDNHS